MDGTERETLVQTLHRQREELLRDVAETEAELRLSAGYRDAELEASAQQERMGRLLARLDDRQIHAFQEIEAALQRVADVSYGTREDCGQAIAIGRLQALPATCVCADCARRQEEPSIVLQLVRDCVGLEEIVDRVKVTAQLWERGERSKVEPIEEQLPWVEVIETEDVVQSTDEGIDYMLPVAPPPEER
jgi:RNA polymerase-binding transcription factor DksA